MQTRFSCPVCGADDWVRTALHSYAATDHGLDGYLALRRRVLCEVWLPHEPRRLAAVVCGSCGFGSAAPRPDDADIAAKYRFLLQHDDEPGKSTDEPVGQLADAERARRTAGALAPLVPRATPTVIDIGGGDGKLLAPFRDHGLETYVVDYNPSPLPGVERLGATIEDVPPDRKFGGAILSHVLEHAADPVALLRATRARLVEGGGVYIEVPSEHWGGLPIAADPVTHVGFFTTEALRVAARRSGFDVVSVQETVGSYGASIKPVIVLVGRAGKPDEHAPPAPTAGRDAIARATPGRRAELGKARLLKRRPSIRRLVRPRRGGRASVVVLTDVFPKLSETFIIGEVRSLERHGETVAVEALGRATEPLALGPTDPVASFMREDGRRRQALALAWLVCRHPVRCLADRRAQGRWRGQEAVVPLRHVAPIAWRVHRGGAGRMHVHFAAGAALVALRISKLLGIPWSLTAHAYDIFYLPANLPEKLREADFVTSGCDYNVEYLRTLLPDDAAEKVHRIVMGIRPEEFARQQPPPHGRRVIAVGRLVEKKGLNDLIRAAAILRSRGEPIEAVIVGDGPLRDELKQLAASEGVGDDVTFVGALVPAQVRDALERADVLACPCVVAANGDRDSMPVVVKEAMAMELPVVGTREVGLPEMIGEDRGRLAEPGDPADLARAIAEVLALTPGERAQLGAAGRAWVLEHANVDVETDKLLQLFR